MNQKERKRDKMKNVQFSTEKCVSKNERMEIKIVRRDEEKNKLIVVDLWDTNSFKENFRCHCCQISLRKMFKMSFEWM